MDNNKDKIHDFVVTFILGNLFNQGIISSDVMEETKKRILLKDGSVDKSA